MSGFVVGALRGAAGAAGGGAGRLHLLLELFHQNGIDGGRIALCKENDRMTYSDEENECNFFHRAIHTLVKCRRIFSGSQLRNCKEEQGERGGRMMLREK